MVLSRIDRKIEISIGLGSVNPAAAEAKWRGGLGHAEEVAVILQEIDQGLPRLWLGQWMLGAVSLHVEFDLVIAAAGPCSRGHALARCDGNYWKQCEEKYEDGFENSTSKRTIIVRRPGRAGVALAERTALQSSSLGETEGPPIQRGFVSTLET